MEEVQFSKEIREKLLSGINKANKAVASTMGPMGNTVIIPDPKKYGEYKVTKDGVSVINSIKLNDPIENIGVEFLRQAANLTVKQAGDGTTTATVLATAFINNLKDFNTVEINKAFNDIIPRVIEQLKINSRKLEHKDIKHVATISANNDIAIGDMIQKAYDFSKNVKVEESTSNDDYIDLVSGMMLDVSYFSKSFITNEGKAICELSKPNFLLVDGKIDKLEPFKIPIELAQSPETPLVIMCEGIHETPLRRLESLVLSKGIYLTVVKTPGFGPFRKDLLNDISVYTGATIIDDMSKSYNITHLGKLESIKISPDKTIMVKDENIDISQRILSLKEYIDQPEIDSHQKNLYDKRLEYLTNEVAIIKVGGTSELDMKERFDRYDDAIKAVACALEEGVVNGGGTALGEIYFNSLIKYKLLDTIEHKIYKTLFKPYETIFGQTNQMQLLDKNIIDPLKVTRCALENAVSVAKTILSTEAVVLHELQWKTN